MKKHYIEKAKEAVKEAYGKIARGERKGCGCSCSCTPSDGDFAKSIGYSDEELKSIPDGANLGLSCGNPTAIAGLRDGEIVLDLGSGAGFDCFIAAAKVGKAGKVIGVDMTPDMIDKARANASKNKITNVDFRLGEIEHLPVEDNSVDVVISNCVINLSPDKQRVFAEIYRVLKSGGRIVISDIALLSELPEEVRKSIEAYVGCVAGAILVDEYKKIVEAAGFRDVKVSITGSSSCCSPKDPIAKSVIDEVGIETLPDCVVSACVEAIK